MERRPMTKYPLHIYMRNEGTSLEITGDDGLMTVESRAMLNDVPPNIEGWGCKYRKMSDGRCFVVMRTFVPTSFLYDLLMSKDNAEVHEELTSYLTKEFHRVIEERKTKSELIIQ